MIDYGAIRSYASLRIAEKLLSQRQDKEIPYRLNIANRTPINLNKGQIRKELRGVSIDITGHQERLTLDVTTIKYDIVLSINWLHTHNLLINQKARTLKFPLYSHGTRKGERLTLKVLIAYTIWIRPHGRILASTSKELPAEYKNFKELFKEKKG